MEVRKTLPISKTCFVCGKENPAGLRAKFYIENGAVKMPLTVRPEHCGYPNVVHGGVVTAALDECMAWAASRAIGRMCVTGDLTVRFLQRVPADKPLTASAEVAKAYRLLAHTTAALTGEDGTLYARAHGRFAPISVEETLWIDDGLLYDENAERNFDHLREKDG